MKAARFVLAVLIAVVIAVPLSAQEKQAKKRKDPAAKISAVSQAFVKMEKLRKAIESLDLTAEQKARLDQLRVENEPKVKALVEKVGELFTEEQKAAAKEAAEIAKEEKKEGQKFFAAVEAAIKITDDQKAKLDELGKEMSASQRAIMKKLTEILTPEQREKVKKAMAPNAKQKGEQAGKKKSK